MTSYAVTIREEQPGDRAAVRRVNEAAFGQPDEADLVERLAGDGAGLLSLVAEAGGGIVGHILFSRAEIAGAAEACPAVALAPVAVLPAHQNSGVGSALVREGLKRLKDAGHARVIVLGHPSYYPRFGFEPAGNYGIRCPLDAPPEAFMALALAPGALDGCAGTMRWAEAFGIS
ncbi:MAG: N-acetyltransferase [Sphingomonadales bacterium]|nr:N-acetyltransferase [Sphingomonadales bacterium]